MVGSTAWSLIRTVHNIASRVFLPPPVLATTKPARQQQPLQNRDQIHFPAPDSTITGFTARCAPSKAL
jgi:hypothetical protein